MTSPPPAPMTPSAASRARASTSTRSWRAGQPVKKGPVQALPGRRGRGRVRRLQRAVGRRAGRAGLPRLRSGGRAVRRVAAALMAVLVVAGAVVLAAAGGDKPSGDQVPGGVRQRVRAHQGRRPEDRRRARRADDRLQGLEPEAAQGRGGVRDLRARRGRAARGRQLRDPPAVADRRVLRGLPAGHLEEAPEGRAGRSAWRTPAPRSRWTS